MRQRIEVAVLVYEALNGLSPQYLADGYQLTTVLPADDDFDRPTSPRVRFQQLAQVCAIAPSLLLEHLRDSELTLVELRQSLKLHLFR